MPKSGPPTRVTSRKLTERLRGAIVSGKYPPGAQIPKRKVLVRQWGTTLATLQKAVDELARDGFLQSTRGQGTRVVAFPPHLKRFGLVFHHRPQPCAPWPEYLHSILRLTQDPSPLPETSVSVFYHDDGHSDSTDFLHLVNEVKRQRLAGLIFPYVPYSLLNHPFLRDSEVPRVIYTGHAIPGAAAIRFPSFINAAFGLLEEQGRTHPALLTNDHVFEQNLPRTLRLALDIPRKWRHSVGMLHRDWAENIVQLLFSGPRQQWPDSLVITDDNLVEPATRGLVACGVNVPREVLVVAHANHPFPTPSQVPAVRIGPDLNVAIQLGLELIVRWRRGEKVPDMNELPLTVVN